MDWKTMLAYITGSVDQELLLRNDDLADEKRILRKQVPGRLRLTDGERRTLAEIDWKLGKRALDEVANIVRPKTILGWHRKLVARKFDGSKIMHLATQLETCCEEARSHELAANRKNYPLPSDGTRS